jgi:hypothetical protein
MRLSVYENVFIVDQKEIDELIDKKLNVYFILRDFSLFFSRFQDREFLYELFCFISLVLFCLNNF